jgi:hypothetical protein
MTFESLVYIIVLVNLGLTIELWRRAARRPEKLKKKFLNRLWRSKPITPKHERPPPLDEGAYGVGKEELQFFSDFEDFADVINSWLTDPGVYPHNSPWRLQELPKSELLYLGGDQPTYGRTYAVFHNQVRLGQIELMPLWDYSTQNPSVRIYIELDWVRLLAAGTIRSFLIDVASHVSEYRPGTIELVQTNQQIDLALTGVLWETQEISQYGMHNEPGYGQIEVELDGLATRYLQRRQYVRDQAAKAKLEKLKA